MSEENVIAPVITQAGINKTMLAANAGMKAKVTHVALGDGNLVGGVRNGYTPAGTETALAHEFARYQIGSAENLSGNEVALSVLCDGAAQGWVREIGYFLEDGTLFAIWSAPNTALFYKQAGVPMASVLTIALYGLPANSVQMIVGAPSVNFTIIQPLANNANAIMRILRRLTETEVNMHTPTILKIWS